MTPEKMSVALKAMPDTSQTVPSELRFIFHHSLFDAVSMAVVVPNTRKRASTTERRVVVMRTADENAV